MTVRWRLPLSALRAQTLRVLGAGVFIALGVYIQGLEGAAIPAPTQATVEVVVLAQDLPRHAPLSADKFRVRALVAEVLPADSVTPADFTGLAGRVARTALRAGQVLTLGDAVIAPKPTPRQRLGAHVRVPSTQVQGIERIQVPVQRDLYGPGITLYGAWIEALDGDYRISVAAEHAPTLAQIARQGSLAVECAAPSCRPSPTPAPEVAPPVIRSAPLPPPLRVSYGLFPSEQP
ncbi:SAF domain-containing protein [Litorivicinus lipolyticus]|uniref:SAF domain-containing protein n=1 Tax=Litorivicinus lipolyticus TaxID=418701 RepID=UPI003B59F291